MEQLRQKLNIDKWVVFGGSWGSTMALIYAEAHPDRVKALIIRGIYTFRR
jgi:proline iminopeptidase